MCFRRPQGRCRRARRRRSAGASGPGLVSDLMRDSSRPAAAPPRPRSGGRPRSVFQLAYARFLGLEARFEHGRCERSSASGSAATSQRGGHCVLLDARQSQRQCNRVRCQDSRGCLLRRARVALDRCTGCCTDSDCVGYRCPSCRWASQMRAISCRARRGVQPLPEPLRLQALAPESQRAVAGAPA